jgi:release factor glutamine methyltransferase
VTGVLTAATAGAALREGCAALDAAGLERPREDAEWLLAAVLGAQRFAPYLEPRREIAPDQLERYRAMLARRADREPLQYVLGFEDFCGIRLEVTPDVLIPRPETEGLVEWALEILPERRAARVADIGTGSGAIACALASRRPALRVVAVDCSPAALAVAARNVRAHGLGDRVVLVAGDLVAPLAPAIARFDLIVANLPYLRSGGIGSLPPEIAHWEPRRALDGGPDGLGALRRLVIEAPRALAAGGSLLLEIGDDHAGPLASLMAAEGFSGIRSRRDLNGVERYVAGRWDTEPPPPARRTC